MAYNKMLETSGFAILLIIGLVKQVAESRVNLLFPISFGVVRYSSLSGNLTSYMQNIGYPSID